MVGTDNPADGSQQSMRHCLIHCSVSEGHCDTIPCEEALKFREIHIFLTWNGNFLIHSLPTSAWSWYHKYSPPPLHFVM